MSTWDNSSSWLLWSLICSSCLSTWTLNNPKASRNSWISRRRASSVELRLMQALDRLWVVDRGDLQQLSDSEWIWSNVAGSASRYLKQGLQGPLPRNLQLEKSTEDPLGPMQDKHNRMQHEVRRQHFGNQPLCWGHEATKAQGMLPLHLHLLKLGAYPCDDFQQKSCGSLECGTWEHACI